MIAMDVAPAHFQRTELLRFVPGAPDVVASGGKSDGKSGELRGHAGIRAPKVTVTYLSERGFGRVRIPLSPPIF